jgi:hypothetical protein
MRIITTRMSICKETALAIIKGPAVGMYADAKDKRGQPCFVGVVVRPGLRGQAKTLATLGTPWPKPDMAKADAEMFIQSLRLAVVKVQNGQRR